MKKFRADIHIHTCLSPCADLSMSPMNIINEAIKKRLHIIGICDHNSAENVPAVLRCGEKHGVKVIGGMEITTYEEVHILAFFGSLKPLFDLQEVIYKTLPEDEKISKEQIIADENDEVVGFNKKALVGAPIISVEEIVEIIHKHDGIAIASHIDRESFSIMGQLGFIPQNIRFDALEIMNVEKIGTYISGGDEIYITSSDAHFLWEIGQRYTTFVMEKACFDEVKKCLLRKGKRRVIV